MVRKNDTKKMFNLDGPIPVSGIKATQRRIVIWLVFKITLQIIT